MKKILKVAEVITRLDWGGSPEIFETLCSRLDPNAFEVHVITGPSTHPRGSTAVFLKEFSKNLEVVPFLQRNINPIKDIAAFLHLCRIFRREDFDIVHTHTAKAGALGRLAAALSGRPVIIHTPHGHNFYGYFNPLMSALIVGIEKFLASFTDTIIALTELEKNDFVRLGVCRPERLTVIFQGLEPQRLRQAYIDKAEAKEKLGLRRDQWAVGVIARLEPIKGIDYFVEAAPAVLRTCTETKFIVCGEGGLRRKLEQKVIRLGLLDSFIFSGWLEDIREILSALDILVLPSLNEAVGIVLLQAQAQGVPIVATRVGGIPEIVRDTYTAVLVPPRDSRSLAEAINSLLKDPQKRILMGEAGKEWVREKFKAEEMVHKISKIYRAHIFT